MTVKYKVSDFAKDLSISAKKVLDELNAMGSTGKKNSSTLEENELNYLLEKFSKDNSVKSLDEFLNSAKAPKAEPKPAEKKAEPKAEKKPEAPKAPKAEPAMAEAKPAAKQNNKKNEQHKKREEKTVSLSELARETGAKATAASAQSVSVRREDNQVTVDTRTVDMNVDRFDARYDDLASTKNTENRRKPTPQGNKQKFTQRGQRQRQQFQKGKRETEFERLQRIQLEKARNAQLKVMIPDEITVGELAARLKQQAGKVIAKFMQMGEMHAINDVIDFDTASLLAEEFHAKVEHEVHVTIEERLFTQEEDSQEDLVERPPVVCVMGHVDHGKTSILDAIRKTNVTAGEAGGITQAIGAYQVKVNDSLITFLDTPGHEAFTSMRARGANMTDIAVLVVAADDGIMPQTIESINHAKAANVKLIVAMNKMDKPTANPERVMEGLTKYGIITEDWGGDVACIPVSALTGMGINDLLERIALEAEVMELKANPNRRAKGAVVEARLDKGQGPIATILVQNGTLHSGDVIIAGTAVGRVRTMRSDKGQLLSDAGPSTPVEITGLTAVPEAGDLFEAVEDERLARQVGQRRVAQGADGVADLLRLGKAAHRHGLEIALALLLRDMVEHLRLDEAGGDGVDADAVGRKLLGKRRRERIDRALRRAVDALAGNGQHGADGGDVDDHAGLLLEHLERRLLRAVEIALDVDVKAAGQGILREHHEIAVIHDARVVHEDIEAAHFAHDGAEHILNLRQLCRVGADGQAAHAERLDLRDDRLRGGLVGDIVHRDIIAAFGKRQRAGSADAARRAGHKCNAHASFLPTITQLTLPVQPVASAAAVRHSPDDTARQASANARAAEAARASPVRAFISCAVNRRSTAVRPASCRASASVRSTCSCAGSEP